MEDDQTVVLLVVAPSRRTRAPRSLSPSTPDELFSGRSRLATQTTVSGETVNHMPRNHLEWLLAAKRPSWKALPGDTSIFSPATVVDCVSVFPLAAEDVRGNAERRARKSMWLMAMRARDSSDRSVRLELARTSVCFQ